MKRLAIITVLLIGLVSNIYAQSSEEDAVKKAVKQSFYWNENK